MAYFYQHIKGYTNSGTPFKLKFDTLDNATGMITPEIFKDTTSLGQIITSNMANGIINNDFTFNKPILNTKQIVFSNRVDSIFNNTAASGDSGYYLGYDTDTLKMYGYSNVIIRGYANQLTISSTQCKFEGSGSTKIFFWTPNTADGGANLYNCPISFLIGSNYEGFAITTKNSAVTAYFNVPVVSTSRMEALYFNATSDIRAKKDVHQSTFSALEIVKQLPIYNFNYNTDNSASIGIIAQEAQDINLDGFDIVNNKDASGENGDYMTVKESKLVYIAWKAIQEQQEIIKALQKEIEELKAKK